MKSCHSPLILATFLGCAAFTTPILIAEDVTPAVAASCTASDYEAVTDALFDSIDAAAELIALAKDVPSAKVVGDGLNEITAAIKTLKATADAMPEPTPEIDKALEANKALATKGEKVQAKFAAAADGLAKLPDSKVAETLKPALEAFAKVLGDEDNEGGGDEAPVAEAATAATMKKHSLAMFANMDRAAAALELVTDKTSALAAIPKLKAAGVEFHSLVKRVKALGKLPSAELEKVKADPTIDAAAGKAAARFTKAATAVAELSDKDAAKAIAPSLEEYAGIVAEAEQIDE